MKLKASTTQYLLRLSNIVQTAWGIDIQTKNSLISSILPVFEHLCNRGTCSKVQSLASGSTTVKYWPIRVRRRCAITPSERNYYSISLRRCRTLCHRWVMIFGICISVQKLLIKNSVKQEYCETLLVYFGINVISILSVWFLKDHVTEDWSTSITGVHYILKYGKM